MTYQERLTEILKEVYLAGLAGYPPEGKHAQYDIKKAEDTINAMNRETIGEDETGGYARGVQPVRNKFRAVLRKEFGVEDPGHGSK